MRVLALLAKVALIGLLLFGLIAPDLVGNKAHAFTARLVVYPLGAAAVPVWWFAIARRRRPLGSRYPWTADLLVTAPWLLDTLGNRFGLFEAIEWWDDMMHALNWLLLTAGVLVAWRGWRRCSAGVLTMIALGFGCTAALVWELMEWAAFNRFTNLPMAVYRDTLGDLVLGTFGSVLAALVLIIVRRRPQVGESPITSVESVESVESADGTQHSSAESSTQIPTSRTRSMR